ncbi:MAG: TAXI family TRAP transporter solute-binding subunit, partial [Geminicoccaceae bacterium]
VRATTLPHKKALAELRAGKIDALVKVDGTPVGLFDGVGRSEGLRFLEVPESDVGDVYSEASLSSEDYPTLIPLGEPVPTISVASVMAAYNWPDGHPRGENVARFVGALFANFDSLQQDADTYDGKWQEVDLTDSLDGWQRLQLAERLLKSR